MSLPYIYMEINYCILFHSDGTQSAQGKYILPIVVSISLHTVKYQQRKTILQKESS